MRRRDLIAMLGGAAAAWPSLAGAQQARLPRIGTLVNGGPENPDHVHDAPASYVQIFLQALEKLGWQDGRNVHIDIRWFGADAERSPGLAAELVGLAPDVLFAVTTPNLVLLRRATQRIPIVFIEVSDPVAQGFVPSLAHPGGNVTGFAAYEASIGGKWLDLLTQISPALARVALVFNPDVSPQSRYFAAAVTAAAASLKIEAIMAPVRDAPGIEAAVAGIGSKPNGGLIFPTDAFTAPRTPMILDLAARYRVPAIYISSDQIVRSGGLMFYGIDFDEQFRQAASYVDRILKGANPSDLPVQQPTKFNLIINLKTAKALGLTVPPTLFARADEIVE